MIEINVTLSDGTNKAITIEPHSKIVDLSNLSIITVDLTQLDNLKGLEKLILSGNKLMTIDLTVLAFSPEIHTVLLDHNNLQILNFITNGFLTQELFKSIEKILRICPNLKVKVNF